MNYKKYNYHGTNSFQSLKVLKISFHKLNVCISLKLKLNNSLNTEKCSKILILTNKLGHKKVSKIYKKICSLIFRNNTKVHHHCSESQQSVESFFDICVHQTFLFWILSSFPTPFLQHLNSFQLLFCSRSNTVHFTSRLSSLLRITIFITLILFGFVWFWSQLVSVGNYPITINI